VQERRKEWQAAILGKCEVYQLFHFSGLHSQGLTLVAQRIEATPVPGLAKQHIYLQLHCKMMDVGTNSLK
jgi:hypothetical protein